MSIGFSIGDMIAVVNLTNRIISQVNSYRSAPNHFQRLSIELGFISKVCTQILSLEPSIPSEAIQLQRIRAIVMQCLGPIQDFEQKMRQHDGNLGADAWMNENKGVRERVKECKRRLHWSMIERKEVDELRAILASEVLAVNTLLCAYEWESLKEVCASTKTHTEQLTELIDSTKFATQEIQRALVEASVISAKVERLVHSGQLSSTQQLALLAQINNTTIHSNKLTRRMLTSTTSQAANVNQVTRDVKENAVQTAFVRRYLERWLKVIVQYCKEIVSLVERNTRILLELRSMLENLESKFIQVGINLPILVFQDPFGERMALPWQLSQTYDGFIKMARIALLYGVRSKNISLHPFIHIDFLKGNREIREAQWSESIAQGDQIRARITTLYVLRTGRSCYTCWSPIGDADIRSSKCPKCGLFLCQIIRVGGPTNKGLLSGPWADDQFILIAGIAAGQLGYSLYPKKIINGINRNLARLIKAFKRYSARRKKHKSKSRLTLLTTTTILFFFGLFFCFLLLPFSR